jgi:hypothetical protein
MIALGLAAAVTAACTIDYPDVAFRCNPSQAENCPDGYICCSDDPLAITSTDSVGLPSYPGVNSVSNGGTPVFSGSGNARSQSGMCISRWPYGGVPPKLLQDADAAGCPVPCNPEWSASDVDAACGQDAVCCQTVEMGDTDCVLDDTLGTAGCYRAVRGTDIPSKTNWAPGTHETMQDPSGTFCSQWAGGDTSKRDACYDGLSVANQRGFCLARSAGASSCPLDNQAYVDACEERNVLEGKTGC